MGSGRLTRIAAVAANTFRESVRERVFYNLLVFAMLMILSGLLLARRAGALILPGAAALGSDGVVEVRFASPIRLGPGPDGLTLRGAAARLQRFFDDHVRAYPTQWFAWRSERRAPVRE